MRKRLSIIFPTSGTIVCLPICTHCFLFPMSVKVGDTVIYNEGYGCKKEKLDGKDVVIIPETDVFAIVED